MPVRIWCLILSLLFEETPFKNVNCRQHHSPPWPDGQPQVRKKFRLKRRKVAISRIFYICDPIPRVGLQASPPFETQVQGPNFCPAQCLASDTVSWKHKYKQTQIQIERQIQIETQIQIERQIQKCICPGAQCPGSGRVSTRSPGQKPPHSLPTLLHSPLTIRSNWF